MDSIGTFTFAGQTYQVQAVEPGRQRELVLTLDRSPEVPARKRDQIGQLVRGKSKEAVRLSRYAETPQVTVTLVY